MDSVCSDLSLGTSRGGRPAGTLPTFTCPLTRITLPKGASTSETSRLDRTLSLSLRQARPFHESLSTVLENIGSGLPRAFPISDSFRRSSKISKKYIHGFSVVYAQSHHRSYHHVHTPLSYPSLLLLTSVNSRPILLLWYFRWCTFRRYVKEGILFVTSYLPRHTF